MTLKDITKFERLNKVSMNVYTIEEQKVLPIRLTDDKKEKHVNLLYVQDPRDDNVGHFTWIKKSIPVRKLATEQNSTENTFAIGKYAIKSKVFVLKIKK